MGYGKGSIVDTIAVARHGYFKNGGREFIYFLLASANVLLFSIDKRTWKLTVEDLLPKAFEKTISFCSERISTLNKLMEFRHIIGMKCKAQSSMENS